MPITTSPAIRSAGIRQWISRSAVRMYVAFAFLTVFPILLFTIYADGVLTRGAEQQEMAESTQVANLSAVIVEEHFRNTTVYLQTFAASPQIVEKWKQRDLAAIFNEMERTRQFLPELALISIYDTDGTLRSISPRDPSVIDRNYQYRDWYQGVARSWRPYVSQVYRTTAAPQHLAVAIAVPIRDSHGKVIGIIAAAESLGRISTWLRTATESGGRKISVVDRNGALLASPVIDVNKPPVDMSKYDPARRSISGSSGTGAFSTQDGQKHYAAFVPIRSLGWGVVVEQPEVAVHQRISDARRQTWSIAILFMLLSLLSGALIAKLYRSQQELSTRVSDLTGSEARYRSLIQGATYGIYRSDEKGFVSVNASMVSMLGYQSEEQVLALDLEHDLYVDASARHRLLSNYHQNQIVTSEELRWKKKDGSIITVRISGRTVPNERGPGYCFEMIAEDITERRALEQQLRQSQKMEAVGRLAGGVAHDFNNLLTVISGYNEMSLDALSNEHPARRELEEIRKATERATALTKQLLAFSRQQVLESKVMDLNTVLSSMDNLLRRLLGENIELTIALERNLGSVKADPNQIGQVIMNLAVNARDAMASTRGGKLFIETANVNIDESFARDHISLKPGRYVLIAVTDSGAGMDDETRTHIFEPFFTTKPAGSGTGLGLSTVYGIVNQSGGEIYVYSEPGVGTTFKVYLPRVDEAVAEEEAAPRRRSTVQGKETILLVEDEESVRTLTVQVLKRFGYDVLAAPDPSHALQLCAQNHGKIALLLTDVVLQRMSGRELAEQIVGLEPAIRVLYMSGYTDDAVLHNGVLSAEAYFLQKPFTTDGLARKVREVLDAPLASA
ncbi:MAG TPA: cache domain-containing protein [Terriglobales bacterium]|nr:cache domain-containing protein [Terriglobales bacterium]